MGLPPSVRSADLRRVVTSDHILLLRGDGGTGQTYIVSRKEWIERRSAIEAAGWVPADEEQMEEVRRAARDQPY